MRPYGVEQLVGRPRLAGNVETGLDEQPRHALAEEERVVREHEAKGHGPSSQCADGSSRQLVLRHEAEDAATREPRSVGARIAARRQDDERWRAIDGECARDLEALDVRQADVEQHEVGPKRARGGEAGRSVGRFADDAEAVGLEDRSCLNAEGTVVVDDEDGVHARDRRIRRPRFQQG